MRTRGRCTQCGAPHKAHGLCTRHYAEARRRAAGAVPNGKTPGGWGNRPRLSAEERVLQRTGVDPDTGCWLWFGYVTGDGYGQVRDGGSIRRAHRVVWEALNGPVPEGLELDHLCNVRHCVNPAHMEPVTHLENLRRRRYDTKETVPCQ